jgi:hypothetical protein
VLVRSCGGDLKIVLKINRDKIAHFDRLTDRFDRPITPITRSIA